MDHDQGRRITWSHTGPSGGYQTQRNATAHNKPPQLRQTKCMECDTNGGMCQRGFDGEFVYKELGLRLVKGHVRMRIGVCVVCQCSLS